MANDSVGRLNNDRTRGRLLLDNKAGCPLFLPSILVGEDGAREALREIAKDLGVVDGVNKQGQLELSLAGVDLVHARDTAEYFQKIEGFLETLFDAKKSGDGSLSLTANALFENAFRFPEGNTTVDHTLNTSAFLRGEITAKEMGVKIGKEEVKALQRLATVQSYAWLQLRPELHCEPGSQVLHSQ